MTALILTMNRILVMEVISVVIQTVCIFYWMNCRSHSAQSQVQDVSLWLTASRKL